MLEDKLSDYFHIVLAVSVIMINSIFYAIIIPLTGMVGFHRKTREVLHNCMLIVICNFSDMIVLPMMVAMNLKEFNYTSFKGRFTDFEAGWYTQVGGHIFTTMIIFAIQPAIDFTVEVLTVKITNFFNRG